MKTIAYDTETTGLYPYHGAKMFAFSTCTRSGKTGVQRMDGPPLRRRQGRRALERLWADTRVAKVMHNAKFDLTMTERALGRKLDDHTIHCTHKMSHILQNHHHGHSLENLAWELAEYPRIDAKIRRMAAISGGYEHVPERHMDKYQRDDAIRTMLLYRFFWPKVKANPRWRECYEVEMELIRTTMRLEARGVHVRRKRALRLADDLRKRADEDREGMFRLAGQRFNPNSPPQMRRFLFVTLGLPVLKRTKKSKEESTDKQVLRELREKSGHPALDLIMRSRSYASGAKNLEKYVALSEEDGTLHPTINTCRAITARQSSENPNLQNLAKGEGKVLLNPFPVPARRAFGPRPGYLNLHLDYAGIEMRVIVHYAKDPAMLRCLNEGDGDVHVLAAGPLYGRRFARAGRKSKRWKMLRDAAKAANFAIPYGAGAPKVALILGLSKAEGKAAFARYREAFPNIVAFNRTIAEQVLEQGYVETVFGRRLHVPHSDAYVGANHLVQCTGTAEVIKRAQNRVHKYNEEATGGEVGILLPVHDEIIIEYPRARMADLPGYLRDVRALMIDFPEFNVPLEVEAEYSTLDWDHTHPLEIPS